MTETTAPSTTLQAIMDMMARIQTHTKNVTEDQVEALKAIEMLLAVVNAYGEWVAALSGELKKAANIIELQNKTIKKKFKEKRILSPH
jgi:arginine/lysine/ornithine decarboxylase